MSDIAVAAIVFLGICNLSIVYWNMVESREQREERGKLISDFQLALLSRTPEEFATAKQGEPTEAHYVSEEEEWRLEQGID